MKKFALLIVTIFFSVFINAQCNEPSNIQIDNQVGQLLIRVC